MTAKTTATNPIRATTRVSDVLRDYPALLDVLVAQSPAFGKLRNPVLRSVQARLVTVEQAAKIAGLAPADLVRVLNAAAGLEAAADEPASTDQSAAPSQAGGTGEAAAATAPVAIELDAGASIKQGIEPFSAIMDAVAQVPVGQALKLTNTFDPVPLYAVLRKRGFVAWTQQHGPESWEIRFLNQGKPADEEPASAVDAPSPVAGPTTGAPAATITIDVSELVPPEPLVRIMEALEQIEPGQTLLVQHQRRPVHLYPLLDERGYRHQTNELADGRVELLITKAAEPAAGPGR